MPTELDIINDMLAATGTLPVTAANTKHPMYIKANTKLDLVKADVLKMGMWFNTVTRTLQPNTDGIVYVPAGVLSMQIIDSNLKLTKRGNRVYDLNKGNFEIGCPLKVTLIEDVAFDDLPQSAYDYLRCKAVYEFYTNQQGTEPRLSIYRDNQNNAWTLLWRDHIRNSNTNYFSNTTNQTSRLKLHSTSSSGSIYRPE